MRCELIILGARKKRVKCESGSGNGRVTDAITRPCKCRKELGEELRLQFDCGSVHVQAVLYQERVVHGGEDSESECGP